jgi:hypothetical protein
MKGTIAILLTLGGGALIVVAIFHALTPLVGLYQGALSDPLGQPEGAEQAASDQMIRALLTGLPGVVMFLAGVVWLKALAARRSRSPLH